MEGERQEQLGGSFYCHLGLHKAAGREVGGGCSNSRVNFGKLWWRLLDDVHRVVDAKRSLLVSGPVDRRLLERLPVHHRLQFAVEQVK
jgi:hypothetical protein